MAVIVEFRQRVQSSVRNSGADGRAGFKLLFFTGVRYERMLDDEACKQMSVDKEVRRTQKRTHQRLKA